MAYWYGLYPFHQWIFKGMVREIARATGKPLLAEPERFAPGRHHVCELDPRQTHRNKSF